MKKADGQKDRQLDTQTHRQQRTDPYKYVNMLMQYKLYYAVHASNDKYVAFPESDRCLTLFKKISRAVKSSSTKVI